MSLLSSFRNLSFRSRLYVGIGIITWSGVGLWISDQAEAKWLKPMEEKTVTGDENVVRVLDEG
ncbi:uncharacterized protein KY384_003298 [Bacidia gigantensis]|uniref:uncharacterized protein n=1 Tax=Bacidia gigantensis TaxID=2732470 RepID=UPI001D036CA9|nr:uncharacterized protein KY384_003298 [Bacidia gigantensis]KAG8531667.1 hypothetical protein KY384_003298 [Bacidia gigantensis]